jgi:hypothetical protein
LGQGKSAWKSLDVWLNLSCSNVRQHPPTGADVPNAAVLCAQKAASIGKYKPWLELSVGIALSVVVHGIAQLNKSHRLTSAWASSPIKAHRVNCSA